MKDSSEGSAPTSSRVALLGNGGHARVVEDAWGDRLESVSDDEVGPADHVVIGLGDIRKRRALFERFAGRVYGVKHKSAVVAMATGLGKGVQIMAGAIVQPGCVIGDNVLVNTRASIDHDCTIGSHSHIAPGAILCGNVTLGEGCFIGAGAVIVQGVSLDAGTFVPAGTLVCGPDDFRSPQRVVRPYREAPSTFGTLQGIEGKCTGQPGNGHLAHAQPQAPVDYPCDTERPRSDA